MKTRICDEWAGGIGWIAAEPALLERASHALVVEARVWLVDAVNGEGVAERVRALGEPSGVIQLLDRHERDCATLAERLGVPLHRLPFAGVPGAPFEVLRVRDARRWREAALWWAEQRALVCADALGTARYYRAPGERLAVHPLLRLAPPRALRDVARCLAPEHVLTGHGEGIHGEEAALALVEAVATARRRIPRYLIGLAERRWRG